MIWHNAVQIHLSMTVQQFLLTLLLYFDNFHFNISVNSGRTHLITIGASFCEKIIMNSDEYYHWQKIFFNEIVIDYVVTLKYAKEKGWDSSNFAVSNPMSNKIESDTSTNRITIVTKVSEKPQYVTEMTSRNEAADRISMISMVSEPVARIERIE